MKLTTRTLLKNAFLLCVRCSSLSNEFMNLIIIESKITCAHNGSNVLKKKIKHYKIFHLSPLIVWIYKWTRWFKQDDCWNWLWEHPELVRVWPTKINQLIQEHYGMYPATIACLLWIWFYFYFLHPTNTWWLMLESFNY